jgi:hypothetical protein
MTRYAITVLAASAAMLTVGCSSSGGGSPSVPSLSQSAAANQSQAAGIQGGGSDSPRGRALYAAAQCIRQHGIPGYQNPVLSSNGQVYSDTRSISDASQAVVDAMRHACASQLVQANLVLGSEPPAPPQLVQAGVRAAECDRANGMPNVTDPTARSTYTPGHGFGMSASEVPAGGKRSPIWQHARQACHVQIDAEIAASTLGSLSNDG